MTNQFSGDTFHLLVWPRKYRRLDKPGYVLGWKSCKSGHPSLSTLPRSASSTFSRLKTVTIICAGILPLTKPFEEYDSYLRIIRNECGNDIDESSSSDDSSIRTCPWKSLRIVAIWDPSNRSSKTNRSRYSNNLKLPRLSMSRRYPWFVDVPSDSNESNEHLHGQLLYYDLDNQKSRFSSLAVEDINSNSENANGTAVTTEWSLMLTRLNYAQTVCDVVEDGTQPLIPKVLDGGSKKDNNTETKDRKGKHTNISQDQKVSLQGWRRIAKVVFDNSFTILHFYSICNPRSHSDIVGDDEFDGRDAEDWKILRCLSLYRLFHVLRRRQAVARRTTRPSHSSMIRKLGCIRSPSQCAKAHMEFWNQLMTAILDIVIGILLAWLIIRNAEAVSKTYIGIKRGLSTVLINNIAWLESFPAGFKLNVALTYNLGNEIRNWIQFHDALLSMFLSNFEFLESHLLPFIATIGLLCGWSSCLAIAVDIWKLETIHVTVLAICFRALYRSELYLLGALFRLFRGKKRNVLRHRTDSMEYDAMQLLVGTICFCICIFLWTTIWVYYSFFVSWNIAMHIPIIISWMLYTMTYNGGSMPGWIRLIYWRSKYPEWFSSSVHVKELLDDGTVNILRLVSVPVSHGSVLSSCVAPHLRRVFSWLVPFGLQVLIPNAGNGSSCSMPLASFLLKKIE